MAIIKLPSSIAFPKSCISMFLRSYIILINTLFGLGVCLWVGEVVWVKLCMYSPSIFTLTGMLYFLKSTKSVLPVYLYVRVHMRVCASVCIRVRMSECISV